MDLIGSNKSNRNDYSLLSSFDLHGHEMDDPDNARPSESKQRKLHFFGKTNKLSWPFKSSYDSSDEENEVDHEEETKEISDIPSPETKGVTEKEDLKVKRTTREDNYCQSSALPEIDLMVSSMIGFDQEKQMEREIDYNKQENNVDQENEEISASKWDSATNWLRWRRTWKKYNT